MLLIKKLKKTEIKESYMIFKDQKNYTNDFRSVKTDFKTWNHNHIIIAKCFENKRK